MAKKLSYVGIDIGASGVKLVELANDKGRPRLVTYGFAEYPPAKVVPLDLSGASATIGDLIKAVKKRAGSDATKALAAIPNFSVFTNIFNLPSSVKKDVLEYARAQAAKLLPGPVEEYTIDWKVIEGASRRVLVTAAPRASVTAYQEIFKRADLSLLGLETESFALIRSLVGRDKAPIMIIDIGAVTTDITVVDGGMPLISRSIRAGGQDVTQALEKSLGVDVAKAEQFKRDLERGSDDAGLPSAIEQSLSLVSNEVTYAAELFAQQEPGRSLTKAVLTGGSAYLPGLAAHVSGLLGIKAFVGDPWARVIYPQDLRPALQGVGARFGVALGLAMRDIA